ncbi:hypothetical protein BS78_04G175500 [Paspalum vaginatum]|nr:hypothetical protein BS78_04G175500 [Paspalum vaginatum]
MIHGAMREETARRRAEAPRPRGQQQLCVRRLLVPRVRWGHGMDGGPRLHPRRRWRLVHAHSGGYARASPMRSVLGGVQMKRKCAGARMPFPIPESPSKKDEDHRRSTWRKDEDHCRRSGEQKFSPAE